MDHNQVILWVTVGWTIVSIFTFIFMVKKKENITGPKYVKAVIAAIMGPIFWTGLGLVFLLLCLATEPE